jgi:uncharacterized OsmC-like protein
MNEELVINRVRSYSTGTEGRSLNQVGTHHFVIDEPGPTAEEITPADSFLAGISACGVLLVEKFAREAGVPLQRAEATIEGMRRADNPADFQRIDLRFDLVGPTPAQAEELVERYKGR